MAVEYLMALLASGFRLQDEYMVFIYCKILTDTPACNHVI